MQNRKEANQFRTVCPHSFRRPKKALCETVSEEIPQLPQQMYFRVAIDEACSAFNAMMLDFSYWQKVEIYDPQTHQIHP